MLLKLISELQKPIKEDPNTALKAGLNLKDAGHSLAIKCSIEWKATAYNGGMKPCNLCLSEILATLLAEQDNQTHCKMPTLQQI